MKYKAFFKKSSIIILIFTLILFALLFWNSRLAKCDADMTLDEEREICYYEATSCPEGVSRQGNKCIVAPNTFLSQSTTIYIIIGIVIVWLLSTTIFIIQWTKKEKGIDVTTFRKEDQVTPKKAKELWMTRKCIQEKIFMIDGKPDESAFEFEYRAEPFQRGQEWFYQFQCDIKKGRNPRIVTVSLSLSRGKDNILGDGFREADGLYDEFKITRDKPLHVAQDIQERMVENLAESGDAERALELQQKFAEREATKHRVVEPTTTTTIPDAQETDQQQASLIRPAPYRRRLGYRRY